MTIHTVDVGIARDVLQKLVDIEAATVRDLQAQLNTARQYTDPHLSDEGLAAVRERRVRDVLQLAAATLNQHRAEAESKAAYLQRTLDENRPRLSDWQQAEAKWGQARMYLDNGHSLHRVLANADLPMVLAVEEYGPHWIRAQRDPAKLIELRFSPEGATDPVAASVEQLQAACLQRLAQLVRADLATVIEGVQEADAAISAAQPWWDAMEQVANGGTYDAIGTAVHSRTIYQIKQSQLQLLTETQASSPSRRDGAESTPTRDLTETRKPA